jgi:hypothetical protein
VNRLLLGWLGAGAPDAAELLLFFHVVRESRACEHELLPALLRRAGLDEGFLSLCLPSLVYR